MTEEIVFNKFAKMHRLSREIIVTEKIDGTNAQVFIGENGEFLTGSRKRWITPEDDNFGFSAWAHEHKDLLMQLGPGRHFGEWWGQGIQRKYGLDEKRWSLFNVQRWCLCTEKPEQVFSHYDKGKEVTKPQDVLPHCVGLVPVLWRGMFDSTQIDECLADLEENGSVAAPGFKPAEGVVVWHVQGNFGLKKTLNGDGHKKGET